MQFILIANLSAFRTPNKNSCPVILDRSGTSAQKSTLLSLKPIQQATATISAFVGKTLASEDTLRNARGAWRNMLTFAKKESSMNKESVTSTVSALVISAT